MGSSPPIIPAGATAPTSPLVPIGAPSSTVADAPAHGGASHLASAATGALVGLGALLALFTALPVLGFSAAGAAAGTVASALSVGFPSLAASGASASAQGFAWYHIIGTVGGGAVGGVCLGRRRAGDAAARGAALAASAEQPAEVRL